jgi:hypothetical protein
MGSSLAKALQISNQANNENLACADTREDDTVVVDAGNGKESSSGTNEKDSSADVTVVDDSSAPSSQCNRNFVENGVDSEEDLV